MSKPPCMILTVCTANRCRSPMMAAVLRRGIAARGFAEKIDVVSAGIQANPGDPVDPVVLELLASRGMPPGKRYAHPLLMADVQQADLILVATEQHRQSLFHRSPENLYKVILFSELIGSHWDMVDPFRQPLAVYTNVLDEIEETVDSGWAKLLQLLDLP